MARPVRYDSSTLEDRACQPLRIDSLGGLTTYVIDGMAVGAVVLLWRAEQQGLIGAKTFPPNYELHGPHKPAHTKKAQ